MMGHLTAFRPREWGIFPKIFPKIQMSGVCPGGGGMFKLRFD